MQIQVTLKNKEYFQIAIGAILVSAAGFFVKVSVASPLSDAFYRMLFGGITLFVISLIRRESIWTGYQSLFWSIGCGVFFTLDLLFWHYSIDAIGPGLATILVNFQVFILVIIGLTVLREKINPLFFLALSLLALAMYLLIYNQWDELTPNYKLGVFQGLLAAFFYALYILVLKKSQNINNPLAITTNLSYLCFTSVIIVLALSYNNINQLIISNWKEFWLLFGYAICAQVLGWLLIAHGLKNAKVTIASFLLLLQPSLSFLWDILLLGRPTTFSEIIGVLMALAAIYLSFVQGKKR